VSGRQHKAAFVLTHNQSTCALQISTVSSERNAVAAICSISNRFFNGGFYVHDAFRCAIFVRETIKPGVAQ
jgi:hypothetical protein